MNQNMFLKGQYTFTLRDAVTGAVKQTVTVDNLLPTVMLTAVAEQVSGDNTTELEATYLALGDGTATPALGDTTLSNETVRKLIGTRTASGAVATLTAFFNSGEANDTHKEVGIFGNGSAATAGAGADSGLLFSRALVNITKTAADTLTITYTFTIS